MQSHLGKVRVTLADGNTAEARFVAFNEKTGFVVAVYTDAKGAVVLPLESPHSAYKALFEATRVIFVLAAV
jgi:S1-C subfamily serine protease